VPVYLVRHAHAGKRSRWEGDDTVRPVSERGRAQARAIAEMLRDVGVRRILTSPFARCVQTVEPLASLTGVPLEHDERLAEGADPEVVVGLVLDLDGTHGVVCSHGDVIPPVLRRLVEMGMEADDELPDQKGSVWRIEIEGDRPVRAVYVPPEDEAPEP
jgi:broad specificity phosphatase PhoE